MRPLGHIYLRLFLPFVGVLVLAMFSAWWIALSVLSATVERRLDEQMSHGLGVLATGVFPLTEDLLRTTSDLLRANVALLDRDGNVALSTTPLDADVRAALHGQLAAGTPVMERGRLRILLRELPPGRDARYLAVATLADLGDARAAGQRAALLLALAAAGAALVAAIAGHYFASTITTPVGNLSRMAERIAGGDREVRVTIARRDEIGALAVALNDMAARLARYEDELQQRSRLSALGEMAARIAHEVRNPLTAIKLRLQMLKERPSPGDAQVLDRLLREIDRLELIVTGALGVARPERLNFAEARLGEIAEEVLTLVEPQLAHQGISVERALSERPAARVDVDRVKQIVLNLVNNAAAAQPLGGRVRISSGASHDGQSVDIIVEDAGPGMPDAADTASAETGRPFRYGLGLKLCRELVELHGGTMRVDRSPELRGARFTVAFPLSKMD
jgi:signal transduction histidine kinase